MKKIVIVTRRMILGGIEKALVSMLEAMPPDKYDVTVLVMGKGGELVDQIPNNVKLRCLYGDENTTLEKIYNAIKKMKIISAFKICWYTFLAKKAKKVFDQEMYLSKIVSNEETEYDLAIAYHVPASFPVVYVVNNIKAKKKIAWIHSDVSNYEKALKPYREYYEEFDKVFCVSQVALKNFIKLFPNLKEKVSVFYNILDVGKMKSMSLIGEGFQDEYRGVRILTVGRLTFEKGHDIIPYALKKLITKGYNLRWYCIGDGDRNSQIEDLIKKYKLEEQMIMLGAKENPYPYIKDCDIYVQPSRHEGYCITLAEARVFHKPIVTTNFAGAIEQIENENNGLIVNFNVNEIVNAIVKLLNNKELCDNLVNNLQNQNINTFMEIGKLERCL